mgnify:CR=1 FL=1
MTTPDWFSATLLAFVLPTVLAIVVGVIEWRRQRPNEDRDAVAVAQIRLLEKQLERQAVLLAEQHAELIEHRGMLTVVVPYIGSLRQQVREYGGEPHPPPKALQRLGIELDTG